MTSIAPSNMVSMESLDARSIDNCSTISSFEQPSSQVRTLFISGLPMDCKPRELYLLFRGCNGYEGSSLKPANKNGKMAAPVGFVTFICRQDAEEACRKLQGIRFDPESSQTIRVEWARSTTKVSKPKQPSPPVISPANLPTMIPHQNLHAALSAATAPAFIPQAQQPADLHNIIDQLPYLTDQSQLFGITLAQAALQCSTGVSPLIMPNLSNAMAHIQHQQHLNGLLNAVASVPNATQLPPQSANPPCSTLFVANLGPNVNEEGELLQQSQVGFSRLRMHQKPAANGGSSGSVCFVEFLSVPHATMAYLNLQGVQLTNNSCIRIEYAKAKMGEKTESNNNGTGVGIKSSV
ncbi:hypothetical protein M3Y97_00391400 [Aphelenchoides bicaudatus]|nr:hypothetical protein M3Y97_00391400 [Aphelenchoides bicaudatus]